MIKFKLLMLFCFITTLASTQNVTLSGYLNDAGSGEGLIGATVYIEELKQGTATNAYGFYSITIPPGNYTMQISFIGYETSKLKIEANRNQTISVKLNESTEQLEEVVVKGEAANANIEDCAFHPLRVIWDATSNTLEVYFDCELRLSYTEDIQRKSRRS